VALFDEAVEQPREEVGDGAAADVLSRLFDRLVEFVRKHSSAFLTASRPYSPVLTGTPPRSRARSRTNERVMPGRRSRSAAGVWRPSSFTQKTFDVAPSATRPAWSRKSASSASATSSFRASIEFR